MHHASDLWTDLLPEAARVLRNQGLLVTVRDHVISDANKALFFQTHPFASPLWREKYRTGISCRVFARAGLLRIKQRLRVLRQCQLCSACTGSQDVTVTVEAESCHVARTPFGVPQAGSPLQQLAINGSARHPAGHTMNGVTLADVQFCRVHFRQFQSIPFQTNSIPFHSILQPFWAFHSFLPSIPVHPFIPISIRVSITRALM